MKKKEIIQDILTKFGYRPEIDSDGDIKIVYQLKNIYVITRGDEEDHYVTVLLPQFRRVEEDDKMLELVVCNKITRDLKLAKVFFDTDFTTVSASCEFFFTDEASMEKSLFHSLQVLGIVRSLFRKEKEYLATDEE